jgi:hypothetical protein
MSGLPEHLLRPLSAQRSTETVNPDGTVDTTWDSVAFTGRITRGRASEDTDRGRQAGVTEITLMTNYDGLDTTDRIVDAEQTPWLVDGPPLPIWDADGVHHYEVPLRRAEG